MNGIHILCGRLGADVDVRADKNGGEFARLRIADDVGFGEKKHTNWWEFTVFGKEATRARQFLYKGCKVAIEGKDVKVSTYTTQSGETRLSLQAVCTQFAVLDSPNDQQTPPRRQEESLNVDPRCVPPMPEQTEAVSDDIPF